jgi:hypothetical protein
VHFKILYVILPSLITINFIGIKTMPLPIEKQLFEAIQKNDEKEVRTLLDKIKMGNEKLQQTETFKKFTPASSILNLFKPKKQSYNLLPTSESTIEIISPKSRSGS